MHQDLRVLKGDIVQDAWKALMITLYTPFFPPIGYYYVGQEGAGITDFGG